MPCCCCLSQAEYFPLTPLPNSSHRFHPTPPLNLFPTPALFSLPSHSYIIPTLLTPLYRDPSSHPIPIIRKTDPGLLQLLPHVLPRPCIPFLENIRRGLLYSQILRGGRRWHAAGVFDYEWLGPAGMAKVERRLYASGHPVLHFCEFYPASRQADGDHLRAAHLAKAPPAKTS